MFMTDASSSTTGRRLVRPPRAAPFGGIRQHEQVQARQQQQRERQQRRKPQKVVVLALCYCNPIDDHAHCKQDGEPAVRLPHPFVPVQQDLLIHNPAAWVASSALSPRTGLHIPGSAVASHRTSSLPHPRCARSDFRSAAGPERRKQCANPQPPLR